MKLLRYRIIIFILGFFSITLHLSAQAEGLVLSAPPRESAEKGMKMYGPIAEHLTQVLGVKVEYVHPGNWLNYQREMRNDKYDIVFDGPHFIAWRVAHLGHEALVKLPGKLQFMLVYDKNGEKFSHPDDLIGKRICGISPPNLSTLSVLDYYRNPVRQPMIKGVNGGMGKVHKTLFSKKAGCKAAVLRTAFYNKKLAQDQRDNLNTLFKSKSMPNQGISVSQRVSKQVKEKIRKELTIGQGVVSTRGVLKRFGGKAKSFIPTDAKEYAGHNMLLEGVIFGWEGYK